MLLAVVFVYMICQPWEPLRRILEHLYGHHVPCFGHYFYFTELSSLSTALNSGINFFLFCVFGSKFRAVLARIFGCKPDEENVLKVTVSNNSTASTSM